MTTRTWLSMKCTRDLWMVTCYVYWQDGENTMWCDMMGCDVIYNLSFSAPYYCLPWLSIPVLCLFILPCILCRFHLLITCISTIVITTIIIVITTIIIIIIIIIVIMITIIIIIVCASDRYVIERIILLDIEIISSSCDRSSLPSKLYWLL